MKKLLLILGMASSVAFAQIPTNGLQAKYDFTAGVLTDASGNNNTATSPTTVIQTTDRFGNANAAVSFLGTTTTLAIAPPNNLFGGASRTLSLWFKTTSEGVLTSRDNGSSSYVPSISISTNGTLNAGFWTGSPTSQVSSSASVANGAWHHVVITGDNTDQRIYLDNILIGTIAAITNLSFLSSNYIGFGITANWPASQQRFTGDIDEVIVYNRKITATEVTQLFQNGSTTSTATLTAKYNFTGGSLADSSTHGNNATATASVTTTTDRFGTANNALQFNGSSARVQPPQSLFGGPTRTISLWFKTNSQGVIAGRWNNGATSFVPNLGIASNGILYAGFWTGNTTGQISSPTSVANNAWHHVVLTGDASEQKIYLDSVLIGTIGTGINNVTLIANALGFGYRSNWPVGQQWFNGAIDDVRVYNTKISRATVDSLFLEGTVMTPSTIVNIPDSAFKSCLTLNPRINTNGDGEIQITEAAAYSGMITCSATSIISSQISDFTGIEAFTNLDTLSIFRHQATSIDLSSNTNLEVIYIQLGLLNNVNINGLNRLKTLWLNSNNLSTINLSTNDSLEVLELRGNNFTNLSFPTLPRLTFLKAGFNHLLTDLDLTGLDSLEHLWLETSATLDTIDIRNKTKLERLRAPGSATRFVLNSNTPALEQLNMTNTNLDSINTSNSPNLIVLDLLNTKLSSLDISSLNSLHTLKTTQSDSLSTLITGTHPSLRVIHLRDCNFSNFNVASLGTISITEFLIQNNNISNLDFSTVRVSLFNASNNNLSSLDIKNGFNGFLNSNSDFNVLGNPNLACIQVDDTVFSNATWTNIDPTASFSVNCGMTTGISKTDLENSINTYPNPSNGIFNISTTEKIEAIEVFGMNGQKFEDISIRENKINLSNYPNGVYFIRITTTNGLLTKKLIKN